jgi:hypothetical protein
MNTNNQNLNLESKKNNLDNLNTNEFENIDSKYQTHMENQIKELEHKLSLSE